MAKKTILIALVFTLGLISAMGQSTVAQIDTYVKSIKRVTDSKRSAKIIVADTAEFDQEKSRWQKFASEKALEKYRDKSETYSIAYNWKSNGKLVATNFTDFSPSGDWTRYTYHYFRPDGSAAKVEVELRTFYGDYIVIRDYYFDAGGKLLKKRARYLDLTTNKPKKPTPEIADENSSFFKAPFYKKTNKLPFASIVGIK